MPMPELEFDLLYRPGTFKAVRGQTKSVEMLQRLLRANRVPRRLMFVGPSGCGKTTLARIMADKLDCTGRDLMEVNASSFGGIDTSRDIIKAARARPLFGSNRVILIDEMQLMTVPAQNALLKVVEEPPAWTYFMFATTDPNKIIKAIKTRATEVLVNLLSPAEILATVNPVAEKEGISLSEDVRDKLCVASEGSARKALVILQSLLGIDDEEEQLAAINKATAKSESYKIGVALIYQFANWTAVSDIISKIEETDWEGIRMLVLTMASNCLLDPKKVKLHPRAYKTIVSFSDPFYNTGKAGLVASCYEAVR